MESNTRAAGRVSRLGLAAAAAALSLAHAAPPAAHAQGPIEACEGVLGPLTVANESLLRAPFHRSRPASGCAVRRPSVGLRLTVANQFIEADDGARWVLADAETHRLDLSASLPLGGGRELRVEVPFLARVPGVLDAPIEAWHDLLGLPDGPRVDYRRSRVRLLVGSDSSSTGSPLLVRELGSAGGFGDVAVELVQQLPSRSSWFAAAARLSVELPTGRASDLLGSGALDAGAGLAATARLGPAVWLHGNVGVSVLGGDGGLPVGPADAAGERADGPRHAAASGHGMLAVEWRAARPWSAVAQLQAESTPWAIGIDLLDRTALALTVGTRAALSQSVEIEAGMSEDLNVETAPDLTLHAALVWSPP